MRARMHATPSARRLAPHSTPRTYDSCCHGSKPRGAHRRAGIPLRAPLRRTHHAASLAVTCGISPQPCRRWRAASTPRDNISLPMHTPHARTHASPRCGERAHGERARGRPPRPAHALSRRLTPHSMHACPPISAAQPGTRPHADAPTRPRRRAARARARAQAPDTPAVAAPTCRCAAQFELLLVRSGERGAHEKRERDLTGVGGGSGADE